MNYSTIRVLNLFLQTLLALAVLLKIHEKLGKAYAYAFAITILIINPITTAFCLTISGVYYIALLTSLLILSRPDWIESDKQYYLFMFDGVLVAFMNYLTYPCMALGIPTVFYTLLSNKGSLKNRMLNICKLGLSWGVGYLGMWSGKWGISYALTGYNTIADAINVVNFRLSGPWADLRMTWWWSILVNLRVLFAAPILLLCLGVILVCLYFIVIKKWRIRIEGNEVLPLIFVGFYPFIWYSIVKNHSIIHAVIFSHRNLAITTFAALCLVTKCLQPPHSNTGLPPKA